MLLQRLTFKTSLPLKPTEAWQFISNPLNLKLLTPEWLQMHVQEPELLPQEIYAGLIINYTIKPLPFFNSNWTTEITHIEPGTYFVDEQRFGPYTFWHHLHTLKADIENVVMTDIIHYRLPGWHMGHLLLGKTIKNKIESIFAYRLERMKQLFPGTQAID